MGIVCDTMEIVKNKRGMQRVGINDHTKDAYGKDSNEMIFIRDISVFCHFEPTMIANGESY